MRLLIRFIAVTSLMIAALLLLSALFAPTPGVVTAQSSAPTQAAFPDGPVIGGDASPTATDATAATSTPAPVPGAIGPYEYPPNVNPLTGLVVDDPAALNRRPIDVKISNSPAIVRPQAGIGQADLVFEHYTEVGVTRFSAIFLSQAPERVGSVRSGRLIDYELVPMYQAILAFAGGSIGVEKRYYGSEAEKAVLCADRPDKTRCGVEADAIGPAGLIPPSEFADRAYKGVWIGPPYYFRDESIPVPHNLFVNTKALRDMATSDGVNGHVDLKGLAFLQEPPPGDSGSGIFLEVRYKTELVNWHYDADDGYYYRSSDNQPHYDSNTGQQVRAANVIVVYAGHYLTDIVESGEGVNANYSAQITVWPEGDAIVFRDGKRYEGRWLRPSRPDALSFQTKDGQILYLKPGNTFVQLVPLPEQLDASLEWVKFF